MSAPDSIPHVEPVLAGLVVESLSYCKFFLSAISNLIVDSCINPSRALARRFHCSYAYLGQNLVAKIFKHDPKSELGLMLKQWVIFNKLENFNSILKYTIDDFTLSGNLCYINENGEILHLTILKELFNLRWYIQHLIDQSEDEFENSLSEENWMKQTNWKFIKYVIHH